MQVFLMHPQVVLASLPAVLELATGEGTTVMLQQGQHCLLTQT